MNVDWQCLNINTWTWIWAGFGHAIVITKSSIMVVLFFKALRVLRIAVL